MVRLKIHFEQKEVIMPFWRTYYHLIWGTKFKNPSIQPDIEPRLYSYLINKSKELGVIVYEINGWVDHVHLIVSIPPKHSVSYVVKRLKGASAFDLNQSGALEDHFQWQRGYGVLTLGEKQRAFAEGYVHNQKEHHRQQTTNTWLERSDEFDEGPQDRGLETAIVPPILHETAVFYDAINSDEIPF